MQKGEEEARAKEAVGRGRITRTSSCKTGANDVREQDAMYKKQMLI
jgi:hypothetical protein